MKEKGAPKFLQGILLIFVFSNFANANIQESSIVYLECSKGNTKSIGSGVIVSETGDVLTAKHVAPQGYACVASLGNSSVLPTRALIRRRESTTYDAVILALVPSQGETFNAVPYVRQLTKGAPIDAFGYPKNFKGSPSIRKGVIASTNASEQGFIETTALTATGMSGGPVFMSGENAIIGIIAGADFDQETAVPASYGVLDASLIANELGLKLKSHETQKETKSRSDDAIQRGDRALGQEQWGRAILHYRSVSRNSEQYYAAQMGRGQAELRLGKYKDAELSYKQAMDSAKSEEDTVAAKYSHALSIMAQRDYARALPTFEEVSHDGFMTNDEGLIYNLARCYERVGDIHNARDTLARFPFAHDDGSPLPQGWHLRDIYTKAHLLNAVLLSTDDVDIDCTKVKSDIDMARRLNPDVNLPIHYADQIRSISCRGL